MFIEAKGKKKNRNTSEYDFIYRSIFKFFKNCLDDIAQVISNHSCVELLENVYWNESSLCILIDDP